jgi:hypothetical protein
MLTLKSPLTDFIELCLKHEACDDQGALTFMKKQLELDKEMTIEGLLKHYLEDKDGDERWSPWILSKAFDELDIEVRKIFMSKMTEPLESISLVISCVKVLTPGEELILKKNYEGKLPTAEKELTTAKLSVAK